MSMTNKMRDSQMSIRWQLLVTVSAAALLASGYGASAADNDSDRPLIWIDLGGQLDRLSDAQETYLPPFMASITQPGLLSALNVQQPPTFALDMNGKISFQPSDSHWVFSASVQYGRTGANRHRQHETANAKVPADWQFPPPYSFFRKYGLTYYPTQHVRFAEGQSSQSETHLVLDFQVGKDVGLGIFGNGSSSVLSAGVRIAQFTSKANGLMRAMPDLQYPATPITSFAQHMAFYKYPHIHFHDYNVTAASQRSFQGLGPSVAWNASVPFAGDVESGEMTLDWGINGAVLFGHQEASGHSKTTTRSYYMTRWKISPNQNKGIGPGVGIVQGYFVNYAAQFNAYDGAVAQHINAGSFNRVRSVTVPNLGGFAGISYRLANAKISFGYKADFFFGAIDGGIDTRKNENRGFYGPFASISVGLGD